MAQPPEYLRQKDFTEDYGNETDHSALNAELDNASNSINDIRHNLAILQADDGKLRPSVVTADSISDDLRMSLVEGVVMDAQSMLDRSLEAADASSRSAELAETIKEEASACRDDTKNQADRAELHADRAESSVQEADGFNKSTQGAFNDALEGAAHAVEEAKEYAQEALDSALKSGGVPIGAIISSSAGAPSIGFLPLDGRELNRTVFADLFESIGTTYGEGNGSTTFNLPDTRGKLLAGANEDSGEVSPVSRMFRNKIINGDFRIWQRGESFISAGWTADRWYVASASAIKIKLEILQGLNTLKLERSSSPKYIEHRIEDVRTFAGKTVTLSFLAKSDVDTELEIGFAQRFGIGGSPNLNGISPVLVNINTTFKQYSVQLEVPDVADKAIGAGSFISLVLGGSKMIPANVAINFANVQLEEGSVATAFEERPLPIEIQLCERYYQKSYPLNMPRGTVGGVGMLYYRVAQINYFTVPVRFRTRMRATPSFVFYSPDGAAGAVRVDGVNTSSINIAAPSESGFNLTVIPNTINLEFEYVADAEL